MVRVDKNIRHLRNASGISQEELALKVNVSPQAVASWEAGRTQPDVDMLMALASAFGVSAEDVIYGKNHKTGLEPESRNNRNIFIIVLTVIGSLMTVAGLLIVFAYFWDKLENFKFIFAFIPLALGFATAVYAVTKKRTDIPWLEGSAVAWTVGLIVTNALADSIADANFGFFALLLIDVIVTVPVILITKGLLPFLFCLYGFSHSLFGFYHEGSIDSILILSSLFTAAISLSILFCLKYRCDDVRKKIMRHAVALTVMTDLTVIICLLTDKLFDCSAFYVVLILLSGYALFAFNACEKVPVFAPEADTGIYSAIISVVTVILILDNEPFCKQWQVYLIPMFITFALAVLSFALNFENIRCDFFRAGAALFALIIDMLLLVCMKNEANNTLLTYFSLLSALIMALLIIAKGIKSSDLFTANVGMVMACVIIWIVIIFSDFSILTKGIACSLTGIILLIADKRLVASVNKEEVTADD